MNNIDYIVAVCVSYFIGFFFSSFYDYLCYSKKFKEIENFIKEVKSDEKK